ncbi:polyamine-modulated factor 1-binding protein 1 isoform X2 [Gallus gallus]|uniref:polyamine-modulated factor 1-binding protein 1 isoform X2 n=1 Tax=Gallus gallus TaxID=9031 RepID=UPI001AE92343|nr:polyamine-modulated factor 1-binding protein 1 isoform X2 [Gallus gallus]
MSPATISDPARHHCYPTALQRAVISPQSTGHILAAMCRTKMQHHTPSSKQTVVVGLSAQQSRAGSLQPPWVGVSSSTNHRGTCSIPAAWEPRCWACCPPLRPSMGQGLLPRAAGGQQTLPPWEGHQGLWQGPRARSCSPMGLAVSLCQKPVPKPTTIRLPQLSFLQPQSQPLHGQSVAQCTLLGSHTQRCTYPQSQKDAAQTDATSADSCSSSSTSDDLLEEHTEQLEQVRASGTVPACGPPGAGRQCPDVLLPQVTVQAGSKHHRKKWAIKEHQCWAQNMSSTGHRTTKEEAQGRRQCHQAALSQAAQVPARSLAAQSHPQHKEEQLWPCAGSTMQRTEEQPCSCARSSTQHPADSSIVEPQAPQVAAESRELAVWLQRELSQWHAAAHAKQELQKSQEQLQALEEQLRAQKEQNQTLQRSLAQQQEVLAATKAREMQNLQQLSRHRQTIHDLQQKAASSRKHIAELLQQVEEVASLKAELAQVQRKIGHNLPLLCHYEEERQQLHRELKKQQKAQEQSRQEAYSFQEKLQQLSSQVQYWQQLHQDTQRTLARREDELAVCKAELAFKEELVKAMKQAQARNRRNHSPRAGGVQPEPQAPLKDRSWATGRAEVERPGQEWANCRAKTNKGGGGGSVETLHASHTSACSNSSRLHQDRNPMLVNNNQSLKEQMQPNEKQQHKIQQQVKQAAEFTGDSQHLQDTLDSLHVENTYLRARTHIQYHNHEQMKALQGSNLTARALQNLARLPLPGTHLQDEK